MIHIKTVKPLFTNLITTAEKFQEDQIENGLIVAKKGDMKVYQKVIAVGTTVRDINVGDMVMINVDNYALRRYSKDSIQNDMDNNPKLRYSFNWVTIYDENDKPKDCLLLTDRDIMYVFEGEEKNEILKVPGKKKLIV